MRRVVIPFCLLVSACTSTPPVDADLQLHHPRTGFAAVAQNNGIYAVDGLYRSKFIGSAEHLGPDRQITMLRHKLLPRFAVAAADDSHGHIYVFGGYYLKKHIGATPTSLVEILDTHKHRILYSRPMSQARVYASAVRLGDKIYVIGGSSVERAPAPASASLLGPLRLTGKTQNIKRPSARVDVLDLTTQTWSSAADMPMAAETHAVVYHGYIYVAGGYNGNGGVPYFYRYDQRQNRWEKLPSMPFNTSANTLAVVGNKLISFGDYTELGRVQVYDFDSKKWYSPQSLAFIPTRNAQAVTWNNAVYVLGGSISGGGDAKDTVQVFNASDFNP